MDTQTKSKLLEINQEFYEQCADSFSNTRHQVQPGVRQICALIPPTACVLDVGCGNGTLARHLADQGFAGRYVGVDQSDGLLEYAKHLLNTPPSGMYTFHHIDLSQPDWATSIPDGKYDWLVAFAVLHHLPGADLRLEIINAFRTLLIPGGQAAVSVWQWHNSPRLRKRVLPWQTVGLDPGLLDDGDVLLDWRAGQSPGLRYVHTFTETSLTQLAAQGGFSVCDSFFSDGKTGNLALYQVWQTNSESKKPVH